MNIVVIGAGGHSRSVCDVLQQAGEHTIVGLLDAHAQEGFLGIPLLGGDGLLPELLASGRAQGVMVAIGANAVRARITHSVAAMGYVPVNAVHPRAVVSPHARLGAGICVMAGAVLNVNVTVGDGCIINTNASVDHDTAIGDFCHIAPGVAISGGVVIGEGSFLGTGSRVIDGIRIGPHTMLGAGGAAVRDIEGYCTAVGVPARVIKKEKEA